MCSAPAAWPVACCASSACHFRVEGATADLVSPATGDRIGAGELNGQQALEVAFLPTSGNQLDHSTIDGDELVLRDPDGNEIELSALPERVATSDRYLYSFTDELGVGEYTVEIVQGSFADSAGLGNLGETESFLVVVPSLLFPSSPLTLPPRSVQLLSEQRHFPPVHL